jgi:hypothetical protein
MIKGLGNVPYRQPTGAQLDVIADIEENLGHIFYGITLDGALEFIKIHMEELREYRRAETRLDVFGKDSDLFTNWGSD